MIEKITTTQTIPPTAAETIEVETYRCSLCPTEFVDVDEATQHHGAKHAAKAQVETTLGAFHYFATAADLEAFVAARCDDLHCFRRSNDVENAWRVGGGAGWYHVRTWSQRCPRNCCYDDYMGPQALADLEALELGRMRQAIKAVRELRALKTRVP